MLQLWTIRIFWDRTCDCSIQMEDKILNHEYYDKIKCTRETLSPLKFNKQQTYSARSEELHTVHNQVMLTINLFRLCQEHHQNALRNPKQVRSNETRMLAIGTKNWGIWTRGQGSTQIEGIKIQEVSSWNRQQTMRPKIIVQSYFFIWQIVKGMENHLVRGKIASGKCQLLDGARIMSENPLFMSKATGLLSHQCNRTSTTK